ncbi:Oxidoreductase family, NAD-binding Rossmann fold [Neorhodopirellula lusitana]|uniref:Oxidoreductase family, NAD-binding Rossmann fold n=1 Tax=Neorhodopirellula lusitana TaxID=445327 RepID=A0ABY1Q9B8_9BACT|nr:Gfo/Idh/MocA family oxidoreductase [Neorhodopirellula lusitana]SMP61714.1 Oxidoreductase family, NAD-binding Rossmann fold [Neorhodopirellula lusitana]
MKLRVGLIGLGDQWQTVHRPALRMLCERFDVRAIHCTVPKLAENAVTEFQADPVDGYQAMVNRDDIDAVLILEETWLGHLPALAACRAGKAIYWAAGLDFDPEGDANFRSCVEDSGVAFMASLPRRFAPATLRLKELIATQLGQPRLLFCHTRISSPDNQTEAQTRSQMRSELIELIDWCGYIVAGRCQSVMSANCLPSDPWDYRALSLRFQRSGKGPAVPLPASATKAWANPIAGASRAGTGASRTGGSRTGKRGGASTGNRLAAARLGQTHGEETASGTIGQAADASASHDWVTAQISCGNYIPAKWQEAIGFRPPAGLQVCCEHGVAFIDLPGTLVWFDEAGRHQESLEMESPVGEKMLSQFHRAVTSLVRNLGGLNDAFGAASILRASEQSSQEGRQISL